MGSGWRQPQLDHVSAELPPHLICFRHPTGPSFEFCPNAWLTQEACHLACPSQGPPWLGGWGHPDCARELDSGSEVFPPPSTAGGAEIPSIRL